MLEGVKYNGLIFKAFLKESLERHSIFKRLWYYNVIVR